MLSIFAPGRPRGATDQPVQAEKQTAQPKETPEPGPATPIEPVIAAEEFIKATRWPAAAVPEITGLRIPPRGIAATLVNISTTGLLAESADRLQTGSIVTIVFEGTFVPERVQGTVVRNSVSSVAPDGGLRYHVGVCFLEPIPLEVERQAAVSRETAAVTEKAPVPPRALRNRW